MQNKKNSQYGVPSFREEQTPQNIASSLSGKKELTKDDAFRLSEKMAQYDGMSRGMKQGTLLGMDPTRLDLPSPNSSGALTGKLRKLNQGPPKCSI